MWNPNPLTAIATRVLVEYLGVAAQFVVEDAMDATTATDHSPLVSDEVHLRSFLINLAQHLPSGLPIERIRQQILAQYTAQASAPHNSTKK